jgi:quercetin dioxygenase-like cupin family protein
MNRWLVRAGENDWSQVPSQAGRGLNERWLLRLSEDAPNFDVRHIIIQPGAKARTHAHSWEQANYVLSGKGEVEIDGQSAAIQDGDFVFIPSAANHTFQNLSGDAALILLCIQGRKDDV